jgi:predicted PolB exonuclease-like 3'-5' exonuclease
MLDRPIIAFDIETIPDPALGRRLYGIEGDDAEVVTELVRRRLTETEGRTEYPEPPWHRIVCICATLVDVQTGRVGIKSCGAQFMDERSHLEGFFALFTKKPPRIVSWNGNGFDMPVIRYRSMLLGIPAPELYRTAGDFRFNNYQNRFHDLHVDLMDVLGGYGASQRIRLGALGKVMGLPSKTFLDKEVYEHVLGGEHQRVTEYCKVDTLETMLLFLLYALHAGHLTEERMRELVASLRELIAGFDYPSWCDVADALEGWPRWADRT